MWLKRAKRHVPARGEKDQQSAAEALTFEALAASYPTHQELALPDLGKGGVGKGKVCILAIISARLWPSIPPVCSPLPGA